MLASLLAAIAAIRDYTPGFTEWLPLMKLFFDRLGSAISDLYANKADKDHDHDGVTGSMVASIGDPGGRPALVAGFLHSEPGASAETAALVMLNADGTARASMVTNRAPLGVSGLLPDDQAPPENDAGLGAVRFPNAGAVAWGHFEAWLDDVAWRIQLEAMMSSGEAASVGLTLAYQAFGPDVAMHPVKTRWQASRAYNLGDKVIPAFADLNGSYYQCTTAGTSGASAPTWPASGTVSDGTVVWTRQGAGMISLGEYSLTPPAMAYDRFDLDSASLQIPAGAVAAGDRVHFGLWRSDSDTHAGDLIVNELWIAPVEV